MQTVVEHQEEEHHVRERGHMRVVWQQFATQLWEQCSTRLSMLPKRIVGERGAADMLGLATVSWQSLSYPVT